MRKKSRFWCPPRARRVRPSIPREDPQKTTHRWLPQRVALNSPSDSASSHQLYWAGEERLKDRQEIILDLIPKIDGSRKSLAPHWELQVLSPAQAI